MSTKEGLTSARLGMEPDVDLKSLEGGEVPRSGKLADGEGEAVSV